MKQQKFTSNNWDNFLKVEHHQSVVDFSLVLTDQKEKNGPAQNILGPVKGQGINLPILQARAKPQQYFRLF